LDRGPTPRFVFTLFALVLIQTAHLAEHFAQVTQKFTFAIKPAHGLIGTIDLEWVHVIYNSAVVGAMLALFVAAGFHRRRSWPWRRPELASVFVAGVLLQTYHMVEHGVKIAQHLETGIQGTPGILGPFFDLALLHYYLNILVYLPILAVFVGYAIPSKLTAMLSASFPLRSPPTGWLSRALGANSRIRRLRSGSGVRVHYEAPPDRRTLAPERGTTTLPRPEHE
jgi:hypothetical protein